TPALQIFGGVVPYLALASPLPTSLTNSLSGSIVYKKEHLINKRIVVLTLLIGIPTTIIGSMLSRYVGGEMLMVLTAIFVCGLGISFILPRIIAFPKKPLKPRSASSNTWKIVTIAIVVGGLSGLLAN